MKMAIHIYMLQLILEFTSFQLRLVINMSTASKWNLLFIYFLMVQNLTLIKLEIVLVHEILIVSGTILLQPVKLILIQRMEWEHLL